MLREDDVNHGLQHDLDDKGIAKTAREEKKRARDEKLKQTPRIERMAKLYREHVLGETPQRNMVPLGEIKLAPKPAAKPVAKENREEVGSFGD